METRLIFRPLSSAVLCGVLACSLAAWAQNNTQATGNQTGNQTRTTSSGGGGEDAMPDLVEIDPFGGVSTFGQVNRGLTTHLVTGGIGGIRGAVNPSKHIGIEGFYEFSQANVEFRNSSGFYPGTTNPLPTYSFGARNYTFGLGPVYNLTPRGSRVQPYLTAGVAGIQFTPTATAKGLARQAGVNALYGSANLNDNLQVGGFYGGGVKFHLSDHFGLRIDARGITSRNPTYGLPNYPTGGIYIPSKDIINNFQGTVGLVFYLGQSKCPPMPPSPPPPAPLATPTITGAEGTTICQGKPVNLHANIQPTGNQKLSYAWTLNGQAQGSDSPDFTFTPNNTGSFNIQVTVRDTTPPPPPLERPKKFPERCWVQPTPPPPAQPVTATATVTVSDDTPTISSVTANPTTLTCAADKNGTHTAQLTSNVTPAACGGNLTYKWTVSEGSVTGDTSANATFDSSTVNFEGGAQNQTKSITATLTVTTETGKTASQTTTITVNCPPQFVRLDDVIFAKNNARVNNCGKRVLINDTAPRLAGGDYDVLLVGHRDNDEAENAPTVRARGRRGRRAPATPPTALDEQRVLNAAAVLSGGTGTCATVDPSRIRYDVVGTDQTSEPRPGQCGTSNIKERRGSQVTEADRNRRVEVYLVPRGSTNMPPGVKNARPLPEDRVKALGCPK
ncbi:MAG: outer membrane beta-barrel protein [Acidobacteriaceae bacterium]|nr:outer membrane beta-barrel protein [Acidobacteriaceae bacterium]